MAPYEIVLLPEIRLKRISPFMKQSKIGSFWKNFQTNNTDHVIALEDYTIGGEEDMDYSVYVIVDAGYFTTIPAGTQAAVVEYSFLTDTDTPLSLAWQDLKRWALSMGYEMLDYSLEDYSVDMTRVRLTIPIRRKEREMS